VQLEKPDAKSFKLGPDTVFPAEHMRRIIDAAHAGRTILEFPVFDGSENGQKVFDTLTVIGHPIPPDEKKPTDASAAYPALAGMIPEEMHKIRTLLGPAFGDGRYEEAAAQGWADADIGAVVELLRTRSR